MGQFIDNFGTLLLGTFVNAILLGVVGTQYYSYWRAQSRDSLAIRVTVLALCANDAFQSAATIVMVWRFSAASFHGMDASSDSLWPYHYVPIGTAFTALLTNLIIIHKIHSLSPVLFGGLVLVSLATFGCGFSYGIGSWNLAVNATPSNSLKALVVSWLGTQVALDILTSGLSILFLRNHRSASQKVVVVINRLIRGAIQIGALPTVFAVAGLVAFVVQPQTKFYVMFLIPIGRLYTMTFMNSLNVRGELKDILGTRAEQNEAVNLASAVLLRDLDNQSPARDGAGHSKKPLVHNDSFQPVIVNNNDEHEPWV